MTNETLEELGRFAERKYLERLDNFQKNDFKDGVFEGAKWQQERMYSEEEVIEILLNFRGENPRYIEEWFEQFKKK
jgi:hypothetical protein